MQISCEIVTEKRMVRNPFIDDEAGEEEKDEEEEEDSNWMKRAGICISRYVRT